MSSKPVLRIDWATHEAAKYACLNWHYSRSLPVGKMVKVGAWEDGNFIGVVLFSYGANPNISKPYGLVQTECCELVRLALKHHQTPVSKILSFALKRLQQQCPGIRLVVSYADTGQGHHGGIYQATNWIYEGYFGGESSVVVNGRLMHRRQAYSLYGTKRPENSVNVPAAGKHKYLMPLDDAMRAKIAPLAKPYPKSTRAKKQDSEPPSELGGAVPTDALHTSGPESCLA